MGNKKQEQYHQTHVRIRHAFRDLCLQKELSQITVVDLAKAAGISRKTFYIHYQTIDELVEEIATEIYQEFLSSWLSSDRTAITIKSVSHKLNEIIQRDYDFHMSMICADSADSLASRIQALGLSNPELLHHLFPDKSLPEAQVLLFGFANGLLSMYRYDYKNSLGLCLVDIV